MSADDMSDDTRPPWWMSGLLYPMGDGTVNVESQPPEAGSVLNLTRSLIALRRRTPDLCTGTYEAISAPADVWAWKRGRGHAVLVNFSAQPAVVEGVGGRVLIATDRTRDGERVAASVVLGAWSGFVVALDLDSGG